MQFCDFPHSPQASAKHFQHRAEFLPLRNRGSGTLAMTMLPGASLLGMHGKSSHSPDKLKVVIVALLLQNESI
jgi:hypothetical protein